MSKIFTYVPSAYKEGKAYVEIPMPENGVGYFEFTRDSEATRINEDGLIETMAIDVPRIDYSDAGCPKLLLEGEATNLLPYSNDFTQWSSSSSGSGDSVVVAPNNSISPSGLNDATKLDFNLNGGNTTSDVSQLIIFYNATSGQELTSSIWIKSADTNDYIIALDSDSQQGNLIIANNEWQRLETKRTGNNTGSRTFKMGLRGSFGNSDSASVLVYQAQLEQGLVATSNISTNGSPATREEEKAFNANNLDINGDEFVWSVEMQSFGNDAIGRLAELSNSLGYARIGYSSTNNKISFINSANSFDRIDYDNCDTSLFRNLSIRKSNSVLEAKSDGVLVGYLSGVSSLSTLTEATYSPSGAQMKGKVRDNIVDDDVTTFNSKATSYAALDSIINNYTIR